MDLPRRFTPIAALTILSCASAAAAQTAHIPGPTAPQPQPDISSLLQSPDPRLQAWGAWYAGAGQLERFAPLLQDVVRQRLGAHSAPVYAPDATLDAALDALIQLRRSVDVALLPGVYAVRPAQALIVASFAEENTSDFLHDVLRFATSHDWFAAANLLLTRSPQTLVPSLLASVRLKLKVYIVDGGQAMGSGTGSVVGVGCGGTGLAPGMPPWATYTLTSFAHPGVIVMAMGPKPIYYRRTVSPAGQGPLGSTVDIGGPTADDRLIYAGAAIGVDPEHLPLRGYEQHSIQIPEGGRVENEIARVRADLLQRYQRFLLMFVERAILPAADASSSLPPIDVEVEDHRVSVLIAAARAAAVGAVSPDERSIGRDAGRLLDALFLPAEAGSHTSPAGSHTAPAGSHTITASVGSHTHTEEPFPIPPRLPALLTTPVPSSFSRKKPRTSHPAAFTRAGGRRWDRGASRAAPGSPRRRGRPRQAAHSRRRTRADR